VHVSVKGRAVVATMVNHRHNC